MTNLFNPSDLVSCCSSVVRFEANDFKNRNREFGFAINLSNSVYNTIMESIIWEDVPPEIPSFRIEPALNAFGVCAFFETDGIPMILPVGSVERMNQYGVPTRIICRGFGAPSDTDFSQYRGEPIDDFVLIFNNASGAPTLAQISQYLNAVYQTDKAISQNLLQQLISGIIKAPKDQRLSMRNIVKDSMSGMPWALVSDDFNITAGTWIDTEVPFKGSEMFKFRQNYLNELFAMFGIMLEPPQKRERMIAEEVNQYESKITAFRNARLSPRKRAVEEINEKFGYDIKVKFFDEDNSFSKNISALELIEGENLNEPIYSGNQDS